MKKGFEKRNTGITLIALVVSIIIILILAGISINMLSGNNSILNRATESKRLTDEAQIREQMNLAYHAASIEGKGKVTEPLLVAELDKEFGERNTEYTLIDSEDDKYWVVTRNNVTENIPKPNNLEKYEVDYSNLATGTPVTYSAGGISEWEILYATSSELFLISKVSAINISYNEVSNSNDGNMIYSGTTDFTGENMNTRFQIVRDGWMEKTYKDGEVVQSNTNTCMKKIEWMLDSTNWSQYTSGKGINEEKIKGDYAIGSPTKELVILAYNKINNTSLVCPTPNSYGYSRYDPTNAQRSKMENTPLYYGYDYWLATPTDAERWRIL